MSKALKIILYVLLGLVALAVVAGIVFAVFGGFGVQMMNGYHMFGPEIRMMRPYTFSPIRSIFGGLLCLGVFLLVIVGIVALINALVRGNRQVVANTQAPLVTAPARTCSNCGKPAQEDWKTCPYCGNPLT